MPGDAFAWAAARRRLSRRRALAAAAPSKLLVTSRLVPRVLLNPANQPIPGVLRVALPGLRPADAEALLNSCGVIGDSQTIQDYLKRKPRQLSGNIAQAVACIMSC